MGGATRWAYDAPVSGDTEAVLGARRARGRESFDRREWADAFAELSAADREAALEPEDLERLATAAYLLGRDEDSVEVWERAHHEVLGRGDELWAARCAGRIVFVLMNGGEFARAGGWLARARRLLDDGQRDCAERGHLLVPAALQHAFAGDWQSAQAISGQAAEIGDRFGDLELVTVARTIQGRALIGQGKTVKGMALLDEVMVAVMADEVPEIIAGALYCSVIEACQEVFDLRRAQQWTAALTHWCDSQPDLVPFSGNCLVHRAEIMQLHGAWPDALDAAQRGASASWGAVSLRSAPLSTSRARCTGCAASSRRPRRRTNRPAVGDGSRSLVWRCCDWRRGRWAPPRRRSVAWPTRRRTE